MFQYFEKHRRFGAMEVDTIKNTASPKSHTSRVNFIFHGIAFFAVCSFAFISCFKDGFSGPEDYITNPSVKAAINESHIEINKGDDPPPLAGTYSVSGSIVGASTLMQSLIGAPMSSEFELYNQTASGKINFREKGGGISASGSGGYITGSNGRFTIYLESRQSGSEAGLPDDVSVDVIGLMSGSKDNSGNLRVKGMTTVSKVYTSNKQYDTKSIEGSWYMWDADFTLQSEARSKQICIEDAEKGSFLKEIMKEVFLKITMPE